MEEQTRKAMTVVKERAVLAACMLPGNENDPHDPLGELRSLAETAGAVVVDEIMQNRMKPDPATYIGGGKVGEIGELVRMHNAHVVIFDNDLSPRQLANIEEEVKCKVLDRSELILDIFAARARTNEARLQVELAQLEYTYPRLRAMWSHLERIVGGAPAGIGTRGPGEQQIEIDRRIVQRKKSELKREIKTLQARKAREVEKRNRDFYTVGLVGYTNAGKSTLFNTATEPTGGGGAYADDKLFATLSTRTRRWDLGGGVGVMLSDTVGFVRDLPHHLVASFKATLEEAVHSDMLLIVLDVAHPRCLQRLDTVKRVLDDIGATEQRRVLVLNKVDLLDHNADLLVLQKQHPESVVISAKTGQGLDDLLQLVRVAATGNISRRVLIVEMADGKAVQFLETRCTVHDRKYVDSVVHMTVDIGERQLDQLRAMGASFRIKGEAVASSSSKGWSVE